MIFSIRVIEHCCLTLRDNKFCHETLKNSLVVDEISKLVCVLRERTKSNLMKL